MKHLKLKSCPFCGSSATLWRSLFGCIVECDNENCGCSYGNNMSLDNDEVAELWNKRIDTMELKALAEKINEIIDALNELEGE